MKSSVNREVREVLNLIDVTPCMRQMAWMLLFYNTATYGVLTSKDFSWCIFSLKKGLLCV
jgi:hypothetical protein